MGWTVPVVTVVSFQARCSESLPVNPLPPGWGPEPARCCWVGPERGSEEAAEEDAAEHRAAHARGWRNYNRQIERDNGEPWAHDPECDDHPSCVCGADERERALS